MRTTKTKLLTPEWLNQEYVCAGRSSYDLAAEAGVGRTTVTKYLKKAGISPRPNGRGFGHSQLARRKMSAKERGPLNGNWKGGVKRDGAGYLRKLAPGHPHADVDGYVRLHRLALEKQLGRYLTPGELVHHINEKRDDNRTGNLTLLPGTAAHLSIHAALKRLKKISSPAFRHECPGDWDTLHRKTREGKYDDDRKPEQSQLATA